MSSQSDLLMFKGLMSDLEPEHQATVKEISKQIRSIVEKYGDMGQFGFTLFSLEFVVEQEGQ